MVHVCLPSFAFKIKHISWSDLWSCSPTPSSTSPSPPQKTKFFKSETKSKRPRLLIISSWSSTCLLSEMTSVRSMNITLRLEWEVETPWYVIFCFFSSFITTLYLYRSRSWIFIEYLQHLSRFPPRHSAHYRLVSPCGTVDPSHVQDQGRRRVWKLVFRLRVVELHAQGTFLLLPSPRLYLKERDINLRVHKQAPLTKPGKEVINSLSRQRNALDTFLRACLSLQPTSDLINFTAMETWSLLAFLPSNPTKKKKKNLWNKPSDIEWLALILLLFLLLYNDWSGVTSSGSITWMLHFLVLCARRDGSWFILKFYSFSISALSFPVLREAEYLDFQLSYHER